MEWPCTSLPTLDVVPRPLLYSFVQTQAAKLLFALVRAAGRVSELCGRKATFWKAKHESHGRTCRFASPLFGTTCRRTTNIAAKIRACHQCPGRQAGNTHAQDQNVWWKKK
jgi:hypothetical protein